VNEERARQGVEHLQSAALEIIAAFRAFLDVAEDLVKDPSALTSMATSFADAAAPPAAERESHVTRIRVS
jgi:hypothetical protein